MEAFSLEDELGITELETEIETEEKRVESIETSTVEVESARDALSEFLGRKLESVKDINDEFHILSNKLDESERKLDHANDKIEELKALLKENKIEFDDKPTTVGPFGTTKDGDLEELFGEGCGNEETPLDGGFAGALDDL